MDFIKELEEKLVTSKERKIVFESLLSDIKENGVKVDKESFEHLFMQRLHIFVLKFGWIYRKEGD